MENLAPPLELILELSHCLRRGQSVRQGLVSYLKSNSNDFSMKLSLFLIRFDQGRSTEDILSCFKSPYRQILFEIIHSGLKGQPIFESLENLKVEILQSMESEIEIFVKELPFKLLIPLMLFQLPALIVLIYIPILEIFSKGW